MGDQCCGISLQKCEENNIGLIYMMNSNTWQFMGCICSKQCIHEKSREFQGKVTPGLGKSLWTTEWWLNTVYLDMHTYTCMVLAYMPSYDSGSLHLIYRSTICLISWPMVQHTNQWSKAHSHEVDLQTCQWTNTESTWQNATNQGMCPGMDTSKIRICLMDWLIVGQVSVIHQVTSPW